MVVPYQKVLGNRMVWLFERNGYDNIYGYSPRQEKQFIYSNPIKSPDGTNPVDLQNPDIRYSMNSLDQFGGKVYNHPAFTSPLRTWLESKADLKMPPIHWIKQLTSAPFKSEHEVDFLGIKDWILEQKQSITGRDILAFYEMHNAMFAEMDDADDSEPNWDEEDDPDWEPKKIHKWKDYSPGKEFKDMPGNKAKFDNYRMKSVVTEFPSSSQLYAYNRCVLSGQRIETVYLLIPMEQHMVLRCNQMPTPRLRPTVDISQGEKRSKRKGSLEAQRDKQARDQEGK